MVRETTRYEAEVSHLCFQGIRDSMFKSTVSRWEVLGILTSRISESQLILAEFNPNHLKFRERCLKKPMKRKLQLEAGSD